MKYEAKIQGNDNGNQVYDSVFIPESRASGTPWVMIDHSQAIAECASLGSGYHLITNTEWTSLARHIASRASNWSTGTVGSGVLSRGYSAVNTADGFQNTVPASTTGASNDLYNTGANTVGSSGNFALKRTHNLANGQTIWDFAGNVWERNNATCTKGSGDGYWYDSGGSWIEWNNSNLLDYELGTYGSSPLYLSTHSAGMYLGCTTNGNSLLRGGSWANGLGSGPFALTFINAPSHNQTNFGFRCTR
jgi:formylglycine-generating enzyme required for sulfatase activity